MAESTIDRLTSALADRYRVERELGQGGMATVYLAEDLKHHRKVAIKVLHPDLAASVGSDRFLAEIRTTANLQHPHILSLFDSGAVGQQGSGEAEFLFYVMPYVDGETLRERLNRDKQLPVDDALAIMREVADALDYAHRGGIIHRDIKPENILLSGGHAVVADFGIARAVSDEGATRLTQTGAVVGTPAYLSPEQVTGEPLDGRSDIYSLGCVLYECLTGEIPFAGPAMSTLAQRVVSQPPSVRARRLETPPQVEQLVARAMATQTSDRFPTGRDMIRALTAAVVTAPRDDRRAIVVLPFANQSPDADNEYFSDGLTEEIISDLAGIKSLSVISRTSSMQLKGTAKDIRTIGRELGVRYVLEGSVRKAGNSLRITSRLIDASSDAQLWGEKYSGTIDDVFEVQERVAREIVGALGITLTSDEDRRLASRPIENVRAFELYLQARQELRRYGGSAIDRAEALVRRAMEIEGETPPLQAQLAWAQVSRVRSGLAPDRSPLDAATVVANALLKSAPDAPYGHAILGLISYERGLLADGVHHFLAALEREPNDADALFYLGICYVGAGQTDKAKEVSERLMKLDPLSSLAWLLAGLTPWWINRVAEGLPSMVRAVEMDPGNLIAHWSLGYAYSLVGDTVSAWKEAELMQQQAPAMPYTTQLVSLLQGIEGRVDAARATLGEVSGLDSHHKFHLAESFAMAGNKERAFTLLEEAVNGGFHPGEFIAVHCPFLQPLRGTARFDRVAERARELTAQFPQAVDGGSR